MPFLAKLINLRDYFRSRPVPPPPKPHEPAALEMLHNFNAVAAKMAEIRAQPNDGAAYVVLTHPGMTIPTPEAMGIASGWINAVGYEGVLNGKPVQAWGTVPPNSVFTWAGGSPPDYYVILGPWPVGDARHTLYKHLLDVSKGSAYLRGLGLTEEAISAAAFSHEQH